MAKLDVTVPVVDVEINGETYRKVDRDVRKGDVIKITDVTVIYLEEGGFYAVYYVDACGDPQIIDEDGDEYDAGSESYEVYEKVSEKQVEAPQQSERYREVKREAKVGERIRIDYADDGRYGNGAEFEVIEDVGSGDVAVNHSKYGKVCVLSHEYVVLEPIAEKAPKHERLKVGEYAKVIEDQTTSDKDPISSGARVGDVVEVLEDDRGAVPFRVRVISGYMPGNEEWARPFALVRATPEEVAAATKPKPTFAVGDHVRILVDTEDLPKGAIAKITEVDDESYPYRADLLDGSDYDWYRAKELTKVTEEEIAQEAERAKWAKIGREVGEYKNGDIVESLGTCNGHLKGSIGVIVEADGSDRPLVEVDGMGLWTRVKLIVPVEQRFDQAS